MKGPPDLTAFPRFAGDLRQVAGVRVVTLGDAADKGMETLVFSTGGGLEFLVTAGRTLDIAVLSWRGVQLGWRGEAGLRPVSASAHDLRQFERGFGGFLNTCGLDHIRQPAGGLPLHGSLPFTPANVTGFGQDWDTHEPLLYCEGEVVSCRREGGGYKLRRRIEAPVGGTAIRIRDEVEVVGPKPAPILVLYHFNLGFPSVGPGTEVTLDGEPVAGLISASEPAAMPSTLHRTRKQWSTCRVASLDGPAVEFRWRSDTLPWLQLWRDLRPGRGVLSVEPCSIGRLPDGVNEPSPPVATGTVRSFAIDVTIAGSTEPDPPVHFPIG